MKNKTTISNLRQVNIGRPHFSKQEVKKNNFFPQLGIRKVNEKQRSKKNNPGFMRILLVENSETDADY